MSAFDDIEQRMYRAMLEDIAYLRGLIYSAFDSDGSFIGVSRETREEFAKVVKYMEEKGAVTDERN